MWTKAEAEAEVLRVTIVRDDAPGHEGGEHAPQHPKQAQPAQMFPSFVRLQELSEVGVHYRDDAADPAAEETTPQLNKKQLPVGLTSCFRLMCSQNNCSHTSNTCVCECVCVISDCVNCID